MTPPLNRRSVLKLAGAAVAGPALVACGSDGSGDGVGNAGKELAPWPEHVPFPGPKPDRPGTADGVQPLYLTYPQQTVRSVAEAPGDGSQVTALVVSFGTPPTPAAQNQLWTALNKALNIDLRLVVVPDPEYGQKMTTLMAGNDVPDIVMFTNLALPHSQEFIQATCADISSLVGGTAVREYPNLANIPPYAWQGMGRIGGKIYGVPLERPTPGNSMFVNRTAMDAAGVPKQWNTEQFVAGMKQLTAGRRWGSGTTKAQFAGLGATQYHAGSMGAPNEWSVAGGAFAHTITTPQYAAALGVMRRVAEAKAYHPDSLTASSTDMKNYFYNGTVASMTDGFGALALPLLSGINGRYTVDLARPYGPSPTPWRSTGIFGYVTFKKAAPDRLKMLLRVVNYLSAPFGTAEHELATYGVDGVHFTRGADSLTPTALAKQENNNNLPVKFLGAAPAVLFLPGNPQIAQAAYDWQQAVLPTSVANPAVGLRSATLTSKGAQLNEIIGTGAAAVVFGRKPLTSWPETVAQWRSAGGDKVAAELAEEYAAIR